MTTQHTPTPYRLAGINDTAIIGKEGGVIANVHNINVRMRQVECQTVDDARNTAAFIVRACNAHDELVAALSTMLGAAEIDCMDDKSNVWRSAMIDARAALAKVK